MLIQQTLIQYLLQKKNLCEIFKVLTIWGNINLFIRPQHHNNPAVKKNTADIIWLVLIPEKQQFSKAIKLIK